MNIKAYTAVFAIFLIIVFGCSKEEQSYEKVKQSNTIEAYQEFIQKYPNSIFTELEKMKIDSLRYEKLVLKDSIEVYEEFLVNYPKSKFISIIEYRLDSLRYDKVSSKNIIQSYEEFINSYPRSRFYSTALERIEELHFNETKSRNTIKGYREFLTKFPESKYAEQAKSRLQQLIDKMNIVTITGIVVDIDDSPVVGERFWFGAFLYGGFEVTVDGSGKTLNPFGDTDSMGRLTIKVNKKFIKDRKDFTICTSGSNDISPMRRLTLLKRNTESLVFSIGKKTTNIDLGKLLLESK